MVRYNPDTDAQADRRGSKGQDRVGRNCKVEQRTAPGGARLDEGVDQASVAPKIAERHRYFGRLDLPGWVVIRNMYRLQGEMGRDHRHDPSLLTRFSFAYSASSASK